MGDKDKNLLYFGDNLKVLREHVADESVDLIYHHGWRTDLIFVTEQGPGMDTRHRPFNVFQRYLEADETYTGTLMTNNIGSLFHLVCRMIRELLTASDSLANLLTRHFKLPPPISTSHRVFLRSPLMPYLHNLDSYLQNCWMGMSGDPNPSPDRR